MREITIFTPTYNREKTLTRLYNSLLKQKNTNFEWLIIDDGSTDNTEELINHFVLENKINIKYMKVKNGGKHRAINKAVDMAEGRLFFIVDSDDYITENAIFTILEREKELKNAKGTFAGIGMSKGYSENELVGTTFKGKYIDATSLERKKYKINGDKAEIFYTDILRKNKFPEFEGEKFVSEAVVWNRIAKQGYKIRWFQDIIYICEYRKDGLTQNLKNIFKNNPKGMKVYITEHIEYNKTRFLRKLLLYEFYSNCIYDNKNIKLAAKDLGTKSICIKMGIILRKIIKLIKK